MAHVCEKHNLKLLTYGTLVRHLHQTLRIRISSQSYSSSYTQLQCGGFLADKWLGAPEPDPYSGNLTPSQRKVCTYFSILHLSLLSIVSLLRTSNIFPLPLCLHAVSRHDRACMGNMGPLPSFTARPQEYRRPACENDCQYRDAVGTGSSIRRRGPYRYVYSFVGATLRLQQRCAGVLMSAYMIIR